MMSQKKGSKGGLPKATTKARNPAQISTYIQWIDRKAARKDGQTIPIHMVRNWTNIEQAVSNLAATMNGEQNNGPAANGARTPEWYAARNERDLRIMQESPRAPSRVIAELAGISQGVVKNLRKGKVPQKIEQVLACPTPAATSQSLPGVEGAQEQARANPRGSPEEEKSAPMDAKPNPKFGNDEVVDAKIINMKKRGLLNHEIAQSLERNPGGSWTVQKVDARYTELKRQGLV